MRAAAERNFFKTLKRKGANYDLTAAGFMCDLKRIKTILAEDANAATTVPSPEFLLCGIAFSEWAELDRKRRILDLLYEKGFRPKLSDVETLAEGRTLGGEDDLADYLREFADRLR